VPASSVCQSQQLLTSPIQRWLHSDADDDADGGDDADEDADEDADADGRWLVCRVY